MPEEICFTTSDNGRGIAARLGIADVRRLSGKELAKAWAPGRTLVIVIALPAAIRMVAPLLTAKSSDPAVICVDEGAQFAIPLAGSHQGGNQLARRAAALLGAEAIITNSSDAARSAALDGLRGYAAVGQVARAIRVMSQGGSVRILNPHNLLEPLLETAPEGEVDVLVTELGEEAEAFVAEAGDPARVALVPRRHVLGIGCSSDAGPEHTRALVKDVLTEVGLHPLAVRAVATIDSRKSHPAILGLGYPVITYGAAELSAQAVADPSAEVARHVGTPSVAEAAARKAAGTGVELIRGKIKNSHATAVLVREMTRGRLSICGIGPGSSDLIAPRASARIAEADAVVGFGPYVNQVDHLLSPGKHVLRSPIGKEEDRAREALGLAARGYDVALLGSGDAGIYALGALVFEIVARESEFDGLEIETVPGITAGVSAASLLGAPLGHDHCYISLSDLLTPFEIIEGRIQAAADGDFVVVFYNPRSKGRDWQLERALKILGSKRDGSTPVAVVKDAYRPEQKISLHTLASLDPSSVDMTTVVIVGSSQSFAVGSRMTTPRGYRVGTKA